MAKAKGKKSPGGGVNSHIRARINYLYSAATYLQSATMKSGTQEGVSAVTGIGEASGQGRIVRHMVDSDAAPGQQLSHGAKTEAPPAHLSQLSRVCISQMRGVSLKVQLRLPIEQKRSFCKRCDTPLIPGTNCTEELKNTSRGSKKPWADIRIVRCNICGTEKRFPQTEKRSRKLSARKKDKKANEQGNCAVS